MRMNSCQFSRQDIAQERAAEAEEAAEQLNMAIAEQALEEELERGKKR